MQRANRSEYVFMNRTGGRLSNLSTGNYLTNAFDRIGRKIRTCSTSMRKTVVMEVHRRHADKVAGVASHMCHRPDTARRYYLSREFNTKHKCNTQNFS